MRLGDIIYKRNMDMLKSAWDTVKNKRIFKFSGRHVDQEYLMDIMYLLLRTKTGRNLILDIKHFYLENNLDFPISICMKSPKKGDDTLGICSDALEVEIVKISDIYMSPLEKDKLKIKYGLTMAHELNHVLQNLKNYTEIMHRFSFVNQIYSYILDEAESSLVERHLEKELLDLYPRLASGFQFWCSRHSTDVGHVTSFFRGRKHRYISKFAIDFFSKFIAEKPFQVLSTKQEQKDFEKWIDYRLKKMDTPLKYKDIPLESCFWYRQLFSDCSLFFGEDISLAFDKSGRLFFIANGSFIKRKKILKVFLFSKSSDKEILNKKKNIHRLFPKAKIKLKSPLFECEYRSSMINERILPLSRSGER